MSRHSILALCGISTSAAISLMSIGCVSSHTVAVKAASTQPNVRVQTMLLNEEYRTLELEKSLKFDEFDDVPRSADQIWFSSLLDDRQLEIELVFESTGCFHHYTQKFRFVANDGDGSAVHAIRMKKENPDASSETSQSATDSAKVELSFVDLERLDNLLASCRLPFRRGSSTTNNNYTITMTRKGVVVHSEKFSHVSGEDFNLIVMSIPELSARIVDPSAL